MLIGCTYIIVLERFFTYFGKTGLKVKPLYKESNDIQKTRG